MPTGPAFGWHRTAGHPALACRTNSDKMSIFVRRSRENWFGSVEITVGEQVIGLGFDL
jgi:hypothetical protein